MAYIQDSNDPNQPQQQNPSSMNQLPQTASGNGGGALGSPQGTTSVPNTTQAPPVQNLQAYLTANAPQSVQMGQNIANNLNQTAGKVTGDINAAQTDVGNQVQAQNVAPNQQLIDQAAANPSEFVQDPNNVTQFQQQENANYTGPASFESTPYSQTLATEVQNAQQQAPDINQPGGVLQLARGQEQNPTTGMSNLDALLLQENPDALKPIQGAIPQFAKLSDTLSGAQNSTDQAIQQAIANDQAAKAGVQNTFLTGPNAVVPAWQQALQNELSQAQQGANSYNTNLNSYLNYLNKNQGFNTDLKASPDLLKLLGGNPFQSAPAALTNAPTLSNVATNADYQKEAALEQLLGNSFGNESLDQSQASQAGTFKLPGDIPKQESIQSILDRLTNAEKANFPANIDQAPFNLDINSMNPQQLSELLDIGAPSLFSNYSNEVAPYVQLLNQVSQLYPNDNLVSPLNLGIYGTIPNEYVLNQ